MVLLSMRLSLWFWGRAHSLIVETDITRSEAVKLYSQGYAAYLLITGGCMRLDLRNGQHLSGEVYTVGIDERMIF